MFPGMHIRMHVSDKKGVYFIIIWELETDGRGDVKTNCLRNRETDSFR